MTDIIAPHILALHAYEPGKPEAELKRELGIEHVVKLASNENPYGPSPRVLEGLAVADLQLHRYPDPRGHELRHALAAHHGVDASEIALGNGSNELIDLLCRVCASRHQHAVFGHPSFPCYHIGSVAQELQHTAVPLVDNLYWNVDDLIEAVRPETKLLFIANPNNPTGSYVDRASLARLLGSVADDVLVVIDEAYVEYVDAPDFVAATELRATRERIAILRTFSKAYGLAGLRVGYLIGTAEVVSGLNRLRAPFNVGTAGQRAALLALRDQTHLRTTVAACVKERASLSAALRERGLRVAPSQANFVLVELPRRGAEIYRALLRHGVIVRAMPAPLVSAIRVTVGRPEENRRFLEALDHVLEG